MFGRKRTERDGMWQMEEEKIRPERRVPELATLVRTATGNRKYQQDAAYVTPSRILAANKKTRILAIVCDGMGGMADGGRASQTAIQMMVQGFQRVEKSARLDIPAFSARASVPLTRPSISFQEKTAGAPALPWPPA